MKSLFLLCVTFGVFAQKPEYSVLSIPAQLKENANAVVRLDRSTISVNSRSSVTIKTYRVVTILNELGKDAINAQENRNVKNISATIYDGFGKEIKKLKRKDFREIALSQGSIITDNKMTYLEYTPTQYPFTVVYESEIEDGNTAFLPQWYPLDQTFMSIEKAEVTVSYPTGLGFKYKENNFEGRTIKKEEKPGSISFRLKI